MKKNHSQSPIEEETLEIINSFESQKSEFEEDPQLEPGETIPNTDNQSAPLPLLAQAEDSPVIQNHPLITENGDFSESWWDRYESLKPFAKTLKKFRTPETLAKSYAELEKMKQYPSIEDSERMNKFRQTMGIDTEENYKLEKPEALVNFESEFNMGDLWNDTLIQEIKKTAYTYAVPQPAIQALAETFAQEQITNYKQALEDIESKTPPSFEQELQSLKEEWGHQYQNKINHARSTLTRLCHETGINPETLTHHPIVGSHPPLIKLLNHIGSLTQDPKLKGLVQETETTHEHEVSRMESDPSHPLYEAYNNYKHPRHKEANAYYDKLILKR